MRPQASALVYCGNSGITGRFIHDGDSWEDFTEETVAAYIREGAEMLMESLPVFIDPKQPYSSHRAKELRFMLEALIEMKEVFLSEQRPAI